MPDVVVASTYREVRLGPDDLHPQVEPRVLKRLGVNETRGTRRVPRVDDIAGKQRPRGGPVSPIVVRDLAYAAIRIGELALSGCLVAPRWVVLDAVGRVRDAQRRAGAVQETVHVLGPGRVPAEDAVVAQHPDVAGLDVDRRVVGHGRDGIGLGGAAPAGRHQAQQVLLQRPVLQVQPVEQILEQRVVRARHGRQRVQRHQDARLLLRAELDVHHRDRPDAALGRDLDAQVAIHQMARRPVDDHALDEPDAIELSDQRRALLRSVGSPVLGVGQDGRRVHHLVSDDPATPARPKSGA